MFVLLSRVVSCVITLVLFDMLIRPPTSDARVLFGVAMLFGTFFNFAYIIGISLPPEAYWGAQISTSFVMLFLTLFSFFLGLSSISLSGKERTLLNTIICALPTFTMPLIVFPMSQMFGLFDVEYVTGVGWNAVHNLSFYLPWTWLVLSLPVAYALLNYITLYRRIGGKRKWNMMLFMMGLTIMFFVSQFVDSVLSTFFNIQPLGGLPYIVGSIIVSFPFIFGE